ncbi:trans-sulfuration enzyme family protein [Leifsonia sp. McL0607]|uniref:trans-sulfuration enzyme family protein n=1 Tax=Leifsonia sp. McL0607 TaxID=3415672 RepID=UPI003CF98E37
MAELRFDTVASAAGYTHADAEANQGSIVPPLYATSAQHFPSAAAMEAALSGQEDAWIYSRLGNPTIRSLEFVIAALDGYRVDAEVSAAVAASGMAAVTLATSPFLCVRGDEPMNIVASAACYGATFMVFSQRYGKERGVEVRWVPENATVDEWAARVDLHTRFVYAEIPANPLLSLVDVPALSALAHEAGAPLIIDATLATPALMRPLAMGADIVVHALGKAAGASGVSLAGAVVARHGITSSAADASMTDDFAGYLRRGPIRDMGALLSPFNAFTVMNEVRDLRRRMDAMSRSALTISEHLHSSHRVAEVFYPGLQSHPTHALAQQMVLVDSEADGGPVNRYGYLLGFRPVGGFDAAARVFDRFEVIWRANDLGRVKSIATIPAIATHRQVVAAASGGAVVPPDLIRLSVGLEHVDDLLDDLTRALGAA